MATIRVASVPAGHVYVQHLAGTHGPDPVTRLADPVPRSHDPAPGQWWPPAMLDPGWLADHRDDFDLCHVHFGFDALSAAELAEVTRTLRRLDKPLVYTAHDLRNPHHETSQAHDDHLDVLMGAADAVLTLTPGAAAVIERRWGRRAIVSAHPHVVEFDRMRRDVPRHDDEFVIGVHAKSLRPSMDPVPVLRELLPLLDELTGCRLVVNVHHDVFDEAGLRHDPRLRKFLLEHIDSPGFDVAVHDCYSDDELWDYLQRLDVSVLPYRFGTHSGWLEACRDLGTAVVAPDCGFIDEQQPCAVYHHNEAELDGASLRAAVRRIHRQRPLWRATTADRAAQRDAVARTHARLYREVLT